MASARAYLAFNVRAETESVVIDEADSSAVVQIPLLNDLWQRLSDLAPSNERNVVIASTTPDDMRATAQTCLPSGGRWSLGQEVVMTSCQLGLGKWQPCLNVARGFAVLYDGVDLLVNPVLEKDTPEGNHAVVVMDVVIVIQAN